MGVQTLRRSDALKGGFWLGGFVFGFKRLGSKIKKKTKDLVFISKKNPW